MESRLVSDRRAYPRFAFEFDVQLQHMAPEEEGAEASKCHRGVSRDVSESGMRVWVSRAYPINATVLLTFECPEMGWNNITSRVGLVVWAENLRTDGHYLLGIRFGEAA
jgi:hypothetical protein